MARGIIIRESLQGRALPANLNVSIVRTYEHCVGGVNVEILELVVEDESLSDVAMKLAGRLVPRGFYCHFIASDTITVVFSRCVITVPRGDVGAIDRCRAIGRLFGIPEIQMQFERMFTIDHPDYE